MQKLIPEFIDISDWNKIPYSSTGGTRAKNIYVFPKDGKEYFFKGSKKLKDGSFKFRTEFWSEIVSSKIGQMLGFNLLDYNIGFDINDEQQIGCLSKSMVEHSENKLSEGVEFLRGFDSKYNPKIDEDRYTVDFIKKTFKFFELSEFEPHFVQMLVFDLIIGNSDRHQENWGFISKFKESIQQMDNEIIVTKGFFSKLILKIIKLLAKGTLEQREIMRQKNVSPSKILLKTQSKIVETVFSPIYDSGCCLGRELEDEKIKQMLKNPQMISTYIERGRSEVRYHQGGKPKHFEFIQELQKEYPNVFKDIIETINTNFYKENLRTLILDIDQKLPSELSHFALPEHRKLLMHKLVTLRTEKLLKII
tara:strand:- start:86 stop:1177 length:1092 start_codon:yes stop_codon:yes gene_type:complete